MNNSDNLRLCIGALKEHPLRTLLSVFGIAIGVTAVILLTSIGEGTRRFIVSEFSQFGTNILEISPGKTETVGMPHVFGGTTHKLTIDDSEALNRVPGVEIVMPVAMAQARVEHGGRGRSVYVLGVTSDLPELWKTRVIHGAFFPAGDPRRGAAIAVLGPRVKRELFGERNALGSFVRIAGSRLRVIGVLEPKGRLLGFDIDDIAYVPVATAMRIFNQDELAEIDVTFAHEDMTDRVVENIRALLTERHAGHEDFTIITQAAMLDVFGDVMDVVTLAVGGIAGISLVVGAIGILTMMWITVGERTREIGMIRAIGASPGHVQRLFLLESVALAVLGGLLGLAVGFGLAWLMRLAVPGLPVHTPLGWVVAALATCVATGLLSGVLPARRAAALDPIEALHAD